MSYNPSPAIKKLPKTPEGYVEVVVDTSSVDKLFHEINEKITLSITSKKPDPSLPILGTVSEATKLILTYCECLNESYQSTVTFLTQVSEKIDALDQRLAKLAEDNNLLGTIAASLDKAPLDWFDKKPLAISKKTISTTKKKTVGKTK